MKPALTIALSTDKGFILFSLPTSSPRVQSSAASKSAARVPGEGQPPAGEVWEQGCWWALKPGQMNKPKLSPGGLSCFILQKFLLQAVLDHQLRGGARAARQRRGHAAEGRRARVLGSLLLPCEVFPAGPAAWPADTAFPAELLRCRSAVPAWSSSFSVASNCCKASEEQPDCAEAEVLNCTRAAVVTCDFFSFSLANGAL